MFGGIEDYVSGILGEGMSAIYNEASLDWFGTLTEIEPTGGYWVKIDGESVLNVVGIPTDPETVYALDLHTNLISYPFAGSAPIASTIPTDAQSSIDAILGEGVAALNNDGEWLGTLQGLSGTEGYWFITNAPVSFSYNPPVEGAARITSPIRSVPLEYSFKQSTLQAFYFVNNVTIDGAPIEKEDLIIAYNGDVRVGSRYWSGDVTDVPAMGADGSAYFAGYCSSGDKISFKVLDASSGNLIDMVSDGETLWHNNNFSVISLSDRIIPEEISVSAVYPNPFNPVTKLEFSVPTEMDVQVVIYDMMGREIFELASGLYEPGYYEVQWNASQQSSGIYFVKIIAGNYISTQKLMLVK